MNALVRWGGGYRDNCRRPQSSSDSPTIVEPVECHAHQALPEPRVDETIRERNTLRRRRSRARHQRGTEHGENRRGSYELR
jgi:hypothetical protein